MNRSPHEPSGSWLLAIQSRAVGNCGDSPPLMSLTSATHAVSYADTLMSPSSIDRSIDRTVSTPSFILFNVLTF
nr:hypothetical protein Itr_chr12CG24220 [Ipomoea trifida]GMD68986.1 hypothetical protein Iba_chr12dCG14550 [Ipomoea batatas]